MSIVATLGVGQFLVFFAAAMNPQPVPASIFPSPPGLPEFDLGALRVTQAYSGMLVFGPLVVARARAVPAPQPLRPRHPRARRPTPRRRAWRASSPGACRRCRGRSPARSRRSPPSSCSRRAASPAASRSGPSLLLRALAGAVLARMDEPAARARRRRRPRRRRAAAALELPARRPRRGRAVRHHPRRAAPADAASAAARRRRAAGRRCRAGGRCPKHVAAAPRGPLSRLVARRASRSSPRVAAAAARRRTARPVTLTHDHGASRSSACRSASSPGSAASSASASSPSPASARSCRTTCRAASATFPLAFLYAGLAAAAVSLAHRPAGAAHPGPDAHRHHARLRAGHAELAAAAAVDARRRRRPGPADRRRQRARRPASATTTSSLAVLVLDAAARRATSARGGFGRLLVAVRDNEDNARAFTVHARLVKLQGFALAGLHRRHRRRRLRPPRCSQHRHASASRSRQHRRRRDGGARRHRRCWPGPLLGAVLHHRHPGVPAARHGRPRRDAARLAAPDPLPARRARPRRSQPLRDRGRALARRAGTGSTRRRGRPRRCRRRGAIDRGRRALAVAPTRARHGESPTAHALLRSRRTCTSASAASPRSTTCRSTCPRGRDRRAHRPERRRQDHDVRAARRLHPARRRRACASTARTCPTSAPRQRGRARPHPLVPGRRAVPDADRARHARGSPSSAPRRRASSRRVLGLRGAERAKDRAGPRARRRRWASTRTATRRSRSCRPAPGASPRSPASSRCSPTLLLLDEPSSGIAQRETEALGDAARTICSTRPRPHAWSSSSTTSR